LDPLSAPLALALLAVPAILVGLPHVSSVAHVWPLLLGVNLGALVLLSGTARRAGLEIPALDDTLAPLVGLPAMVAGFLTLRLLG